MGKISKIQIVIFLYEKLRRGEIVRMDVFMAEFNISIRTFRRYISEINAYLSNQFMNEEVVYDFKERTYKIK